MMDVLQKIRINKKLVSVRSGAEFDPSRVYRYRLWRIWNDALPYCAFIGLNPSTADETEGDPTIRRCINFSASWGYGGYYMLNIWALRSTDPAGLYTHATPNGPEGVNDQTIRYIAKAAGLVLAAWGEHGKYRERGNQVRDMLQAAGVNLHYLKLNKSKQPMHPLYASSTLKPLLWS